MTGGLKKHETERVPDGIHSSYYGLLSMPTHGLLIFPFGLNRAGGRNTIGASVNKHTRTHKHTTHPIVYQPLASVICLTLSISDAKHKTNLKI